MGGLAAAVNVTKGRARARSPATTCESWTITMGELSKTEQCLTTDVTYPGQIWDAYRDFATSMRARWRRWAPWRRGVKDMQEKMKEMKGLPLATTNSTTRDGQDEHRLAGSDRDQEGPRSPPRPGRSPPATSRWNRRSRRMIKQREVAPGARSSPPTGSPLTSASPASASPTCAGTSTPRGGAATPTRAGHIQGAVFLDMDADLVRPGRRPRPARRPPSLAFAGAGEARDGREAGSAPTPASWPTTTSRERWRPASGTCCGPTATTRWRSSTAALARWLAEGRPLDRPSCPRRRPRSSRRGSGRASCSTRRRWSGPHRDHLVLDARAGRALPRRDGADRHEGRPRPRGAERPLLREPHAGWCRLPAADELRARYASPRRRPAGADRLLRLRRHRLPRPARPRPRGPPGPPLRGLLERLEQRSRSPRGHRARARRSGSVVEPQAPRQALRRM